MPSLPIPTKLAPYLSILNFKSNDLHVNAKLTCGCGADHFHLHVFGTIEKSLFSTLSLCVNEVEDMYVLIVAAVCAECGKQIEVFNSLTDGYNAILCEDPFSFPTSPLKEVDCPKCHHNAYQVTINIESLGKEVLLEDGISERWNDVFTSIGIDLLCIDCGNKHKGFVDYETA